MAYIYSITNLQNNKLYVGKTSKSNPYDRWKQHLQLARNKDNISEDNSVHSMPIVRAISKYGADNFKFRVLEECTEESVNEREKHYIEKYNTADGVGYNCTYGGEGISKPKKYWSNHPSSKPVSCYTLDGEWVRDYESIGLAADDKGNGKGKSSINFCISCILQLVTLIKSSYCSGVIIILVDFSLASFVIGCISVKDLSQSIQEMYASILFDIIVLL